MARTGGNGASSSNEVRSTPSAKPAAATPGAKPAAARSGTAKRLPPRWSGWRTSFTLLILVLVLGVVPVILGGEVLGWWQATQVAPFLSPRALPF